MSMNIQTVGNVISVVGAHGIKVIVIGGWSVDGCVGAQRRQHSDLDVLVAAEDFAKCIHVLTQTLGYTWKSTACFLTGCQKAELVTLQNEILDLFAYVQTPQGIRFEGLLFAVEATHDSLDPPHEITIEDVSFRVLRPYVVKNLTDNLSQVPEDKETVSGWLTKPTSMCVTEQHRFSQTRQVILQGDV